MKLNDDKTEWQLKEEIEERSYVWQASQSRSALNRSGSDEECERDCTDRPDTIKSSSRARKGKKEGSGKPASDVSSIDLWE